MHNVVYECNIYLCHNIAEILLMLALNTNQSTNIFVYASYWWDVDVCTPVLTIYQLHVYPGCQL